MLDLQNCENNEISFYSKQAQKEIKLFFKDPEPDFVLEFKQKILTLFLDKKYKDANEYKLLTGLRLVTGIQDNDFAFAGKPISSNPNSDFFRADWKDLLIKNHNGVKLIEKLVDLLFNEDSVFVIKKEEKFPFEKSSAD